MDAPELLRVRVLPAEFSRLLGVSKTTVSRWIAAGKIAINPVDGRLDLQTGVQQVLSNTSPGRMRARALRVAVGDLAQLRRTAAEADERVAEVEARLGAELAAARRRIEYLDHFADDLDCILEGVLKLVVESELAFRGTSSSDEWSDLVRRIEGEAAATCDELYNADDTDDALDALTAREAPAPEGEGGDAA